MNKDQQKKFIEINHAISGYHGDELKLAALTIYQTRKDILKKLERKKKLAAVINDELYSYLEKFPEEKMGLHQQSFKKKKAKLLEADQKVVYSTPSFQSKVSTTFCKLPKEQINKFNHLFAHPLLQGNSDSNQ